MIYLLRSLSTLLVWFFIIVFLGIALTRNVRKKGFKEKFGWNLCFTVVLILFLLSTSAVSNLLLYLLERNYQPPSKEALSNLDAIVILSGGIRHRNFPEGAEAGPTTYSRLFNGLRIFKESNAQLLILQGTSRPDSESDALIMAKLAEQLGVPGDRIIAETKSRNTFEHARQLRKIFPFPKKIRLGIVTSAIHMRRSENAFRKKFPADYIVFVPVDYRSSVLKYDLEDFVPSADALVASNDAVHELIGILWYSIRQGMAK